LFFPKAQEGDGGILAEAKVVGAIAQGDFCPAVFLHPNPVSGTIGFIQFDLYPLGSPSFASFHDTLRRYNFAGRLFLTGLRNPYTW
jgi:hypothetical protein